MSSPSKSPASARFGGEPPAKQGKVEKKKAAYIFAKQLRYSVDVDPQCTLDGSLMLGLCFYRKPSDKPNAKYPAGQDLPVPEFDVLRPIIEAAENGGRKNGCLTEVKTHLLNEEGKKQLLFVCTGLADAKRVQYLIGQNFECDMAYWTDDWKFYAGLKKQKNDEFCPNEIVATIKDDLTIAATGPDVLRDIMLAPTYQFKAVPDQTDCPRVLIRSATKEAHKAMLEELKDMGAYFNIPVSLCTKPIPAISRLRPHPAITVQNHLRLASLKEWCGASAFMSMLTAMDAPPEELMTAWQNLLTQQASWSNWCVDRKWIGPLVNFWQ